MRRLRSPATVAAAAAAAASLTDVAYADGVSLFHRQSAAPPPPAASSSSSGFDPESLERGAHALRKINSSPYAKQLFDLMRKQEETRLAEVVAEKVQFAINQMLREIERMQKVGENYRNNIQQQAQSEAQNLRYQDELARKRMQAEREAQRRQDAELVKMQGASAIRREEARRATELKSLEEMLQTEKENAKIQRESARAKALAEAEGRAHEAKLSEDYNRRMLLERMSGEREKWLAAINTTFSHIEGGFRMLLTDRGKLLMGIGGVTALAAGVYTTREGARVMWGYINRILGQPSLICESSMPKFPLLGFKALKPSSASLLGGAGFENVILHPSLEEN